MGLSEEDARELERSTRGRWYRQSLQAKALHAELIDLLGGECKKCGSEDELQVHHLDGRKWEPREMSYVRRVRRYWREYRAGVRLGVLCKDCNGWDGQRRQSARDRRKRARKDKERRGGSVEP